MPYELPYKMPNKETINDMVTQTPSGSGSNVNQNISITIAVTVDSRKKCLTRSSKTFKALISHPHVKKLGKFQFCYLIFSYILKLKV